MPEPWDTIRVRAAELHPDSWGTPNEVAEIAVPTRRAGDRKEATAILKEIAGNCPFTSRSGLTARLRRRSVGNSRQWNIKEEL